MWYVFNMPPKRQKPQRPLSSNAENAIRKALDRQGPMSYSELLKCGASGEKLKRMSIAGLIVSLGNGIYAPPRLDPFVAAVLATAKYYPKAVISGLTALQIHDLSQEYVTKIDVDIPRETSIRNRMLDVHRIPQRRLLGIITMPYHGKKIRIYDRERALCDAYRMSPATSLFFKALKRYVAGGKIRSDMIARYDKVLGTAVLMHLQQELAHG